MKHPTSFKISTSADVVRLNAVLSDILETGKTTTIHIVDKKRTNDQNAMFYKLYRTIAAQTEDQSPNDVRRECKLNHGIPIILFADGFEEFSAVWSTISPDLTYEQKLQSMEFIDVTSLFGKREGTEYIDTIIRVYSQAGFALADIGRWK